MVEQEILVDRDNASTVRYSPPGTAATIESMLSKQAVLLEQARDLSQGLNPLTRYQLETGAVVTGLSEPALAYIEATTEVEEINDRITLLEADSRAFLEAMIQQHLPPPPKNEWATVRLPSANGLRLVNIPFDREEVQAIRRGNAARAKLHGYACENDSAAMTFDNGTDQIPLVSPAEKVVFLGNLRREPIIRNVIITAQKAENLLLFPEDSIFTPRGRTRQSLMVVRDVPEKLKAFPRRGKKS